MRTKTMRATYCEIVYCHRSTHRAKNDSFPLSLIIQNLIGDFSRFWWGLGNSDEICRKATEGFPVATGPFMFGPLLPSLPVAASHFRKAGTRSPRWPGPTMYIIGYWIWHAYYWRDQNCHPSRDSMSRFYRPHLLGLTSKGWVETKKEEGTCP